MIFHMKKRMRKKNKQIVSTAMAVALTVTLIPSISAFTAENYEINSCVLFAQGGDDSIRIESQSVSMNGDVVTNGNFLTSFEYGGIYGNVFENQENSMIDFQPVIEELYFYNDVDYIEYDYNSINSNENIVTPTFVEGAFMSEYNVSISDSALMAIDDISITASTFNSTNSVLYSQLGDIYVKTDVFSSSGLIYAPFGTVYIEGGTVNINGLIIAQNIEIIGDYTVNINKNDAFVEKFGGGATVSADVAEDDDIIDMGVSYYKDITSEDDIIYAGDGIYCVKNQFLITGSDSANFDEIAALVSNYNASIVGYIELTNDYQVEFDYDVSIDYINTVICEIEQYTTLVEHASINIVSLDDEDFYTNDTEWNTTWNETNPTGKNWGIETIKLESALINLGVISDSSSTSSDVDTSHLYNIKIGLIDSGFDENHEDLNFTDICNNYSPLVSTDKKDHGTHVAGTMGALFNNNVGITGICVKNRLYGFSMQGDSDSNILDKNYLFKMKYALTWMIGNNVKVINYSRGKDDIAFCAAQDSSIYPNTQNAVNYQEASAKEYEKFLSKLISMGYDFLIVTSAGNANNDIYYYDPASDYGFVNISDYEEDRSKYPFVDTTKQYGGSGSGASIILNDADAKYSNAFQCISSYKVKSHVVSVGSLSSTCDVSDFSCRGSRVDILAPGEDIWSSITTGTGDGGKNYDKKNGTSMAAPHVSGALGLAYSAFPLIRASLLKGILTSEASDFGLIESVISESGTIIDKNYKVLNADTLTSETLDKLNKLTTSGETSASQYNGIAIGFVLDENKKPLSDVNITATLQDPDGVYDYNASIQVGTTSEDGSFEVILPPGKYYLVFEKTGYLGEMVYFEAVPEEMEYIGEITLFDESWRDSIFQVAYGKVSDAITGKAVKGATVKFRKGWNNTTGEYLSNLLGDKIATTDDTGNYSMALSVGAYTAEISKDGYITSYVNIVSAPDVIIHFSTITPVLDDDEYRIILTWGDEPRDLDAHLIGAIDGNSYEIYYGNKTFTYNGETIASLDHDDTSSYGPETITLTWKENSGSCTYYVYDYTNKTNSDSMALTYSSARVLVYKGNSLIKSYSVPIGYSGTKWAVFTISDGTLTTINTIS